MEPDRTAAACKAASGGSGTRQSFLTTSVSYASTNAISLTQWWSWQTGFQRVNGQQRSMHRPGHTSQESQFRYAFKLIATWLSRGFRKSTSVTSPEPGRCRRNSGFGVSDGREPAYNVVQDR